MVKAIWEVVESPKTGRTATVQIFDPQKTQKLSDGSYGQVADWKTSVIVELDDQSCPISSNSPHLAEDVSIWRK